MIGDSVRRREDLPLLLGRARFVGDVRLPNQASMRVVRSPVGHGRILAMDLDAVRAMPGVLGAWSAADVDLPHIDFRQVSFEQMLPYRQPVLARDRVRYVGEPMAIIVAEDPYVAEDAEDLVALDIEELPAVLDPRLEPGDFSDGLKTNALDFEFAYGEDRHAPTPGESVVEITVRVGRHTGVPMECRGAVADFDPATGRLHILGAAKVPHYNRDALSKMLNIPPSHIVLEELHVGGGFGIRGELYPEDVLVAWASMELGCPVSWIEDRREHLISANHSRDQVHRLSAVVTQDGFIRSLQDEFWLDQGAYVRTHAATVPTLTASMLPGPYQIPSFRVHGHVRLTNKTPAGTYRAPGRYEGTFARERLIDAIASTLNLDPMEVRARNFISSDQMPYARPLEALGTHVEYDSGDYAGLVSKARSTWRLGEIEAELDARRQSGEWVGLGYAFFVEKSGLGPFEGVRMSFDEAGLLTVTTGGASVGQGFETTLAQVASSVIPVPPEKIDIVHGNTELFPYGMGAFASRLSVMAGSAALLAAEAILDKARMAFARKNEVDPRDIEVTQAGLKVIGSPDVSATFADIACWLRPVSAAALEMSPGLTSEEWFYSDHMNYPYGFHVAQVAIDRDTLDIRVEKYWVAYDVGRALNPMLVEGQIVGGAAQGLGGALLEDFQYDEAGQPLCTSFLDYLLPTAAEMPPTEVLLAEDSPSPLNPLGVKGAGEGGTTAYGAAIASAVDNAVGVWMVDTIPVTPNRLRSWLQRSDV